VTTSIRSSMISFWLFRNRRPKVRNPSVASVQVSCGWQSAARYQENSL
jgi:hypothetical protein